MAFVLVQHLAPDHESILTELVQHHTHLEVFEVEDGMTVQRDCVYVIPPNHDMAFLHGTLQLMEPGAPHGQRLPINFFFRSLAQDQQERAICIVLSGTGSDGTEGAKAIKAQGGLVLAQTPDSTEFDGMPSSVIEAGVVDYELPPAQMPAQLSSYLAHAFGKSHRSKNSATPNAANALKKIVVLLRAQTGHDFGQYKSNTIHRRIERRMVVHQIENINAYVQYLQQTPTEVEALFRDLLIGVTHFFRDPEAFLALEKEVIPELFKGKPPEANIRVWSPGCSTGEEAYSIAILMKECMEALKQNYRVLIFATDIDPQAIATARAGVYPTSIATELSPERLSRFFSVEPNNSGYRIHKSIRDMLVFSEQDLIKDPPFSRLDLISCRNLLIYLDGVLQKKLIPLFHYALNPGGYLFQGTSETIGDFNELFEVRDRQAKLYQRKELRHGTASEALERILPPMRGMTPSGAKGPSKKAPPAGKAPKGAPQAPALEEEEKEILQCPGLSVRTRGEVTTVNLTIRPLSPDSKQKTSRYLFILDGNPPTELANHPVFPQDGQFATFKQELEASNEDLRSSNEEMQSVNEEMQSSNEELETSKEELQALNEELETVNSELQAKIAGLTRANNDMNNLMIGTGMGTVFLGPDLHILRFTPDAARLINLIPSDVGRPVGHLASNLVGYDSLVADVQAVMDTLVPKELEVRTKEGNWYTLSIQLYRTLDNVIEGAVISFVDISNTKRAEASSRLNESLFQGLAASLTQLTWTCRPDGFYDYLSPQWVEFTGVAMNHQVGSGWLKQVHADDRAALKTEWQRALANGDRFSAEFRLRHHNGKYHRFAMEADALRDDAKGILKWYGLITDTSGAAGGTDAIRQGKTGGAP